MEVLPKGHQTVSTSTIVISPDHLSPAPSTPLTMKTPDPKSLGPAASLVESKETPENTEEDPDDPEPAADISNCNTPLISCTAYISEQ